MVGSSQCREVAVHEHIRSFVLMIAFGILVATIISGKLSFYNFGVK